MSVFGLKIIAIITMTIDHIAAIIGTSSIDTMPYEVMVALRIIGRISFPLFIFMIANGYMHTKSKLKYISRMITFAVISQIPYSLGFGMLDKNVNLMISAFKLDSVMLILNIVIFVLVLAITRNVDQKK